MKQIGTRDESSVPGLLLIGSSRNTLNSAAGAGDSSRVPTHALPDNDFTRGELAKMPTRFQKKVRVDWNGCWIWTGSIDRAGYSEIKVDTFRKTSGHRFAYMKLIGDIPEDVECDHMCDRRRCSNPYHVQLVGHSENRRRGFDRLRSLLRSSLSFASGRSSGTRRTLSRLVLSDVVASWNSRGDKWKFLEPGRPDPDRVFPDMRVSKVCKACGIEKPVADFYRVYDESASVKDYWYPSSRCKPCHNALRAENRRIRKEKLFPLISSSSREVPAGT